MRKYQACCFLHKMMLIFGLLMGLSYFGFSQEEGGGLEEKLNLVITEIHKPKFEKTPTQASSATVDDNEMSYKYYDNSDEWMIVGFRYTLDDFTAEGTSKPTKEERKLNPLVPEITFKVYIEGISKSLKKDSLNVLLTGSATYVHIMKTDSSSRYRYGVFFVPPEAVELYDLKQTHSSGKGNIRVEAYIGEKKALQGKNGDESFKDLKEKDETWEKDFKNMGKHEGYVLTKDLTPWALASLDRFPMLKPKTSSEKK